MAEVVADGRPANLCAQETTGETSVNANESLGSLGWAALAVILLGVLMALWFGFASTFYLAILLVPVVFVALLQLCGGPVEA